MTLAMEQDQLDLVSDLSTTDYETDHLKTYAGFTHMVAWFTVHVLIDLIGIAAFVTGHAGIGFLFIILGTATLIAGIATLGRAVRHALGANLGKGYGSRESAADLASG